MVVSWDDRTAFYWGVSMNKLFYGCVILVLALIASCKTRNSNQSYMRSLPNEGWRELSSSYFSEQVMDALRETNWDFVSSPALLKIDRIFQTGDMQFLNRFGTPQIPVDGIAFLHEALDLLPTSMSDEHRTVVSPVDGQARVIADQPGSGAASAYRTALIVYDEKSHFVLSFLHVLPEHRFSRDKFISIKKGDVIGKIADFDSSRGEENDKKYAHTHFSVIDVPKGIVVNPLRFLSSYRDQVKPEIVSVSLLNDEAKVIDTLQPGKLDIVLEAFDRDDGSALNFEISNISYEVLVDGVRVKSVSHCDLDVFSEQNFLNIFDVRSLLDLNQMTKDFQEQKMDSNLFWVNRSFRYALSHLATNPETGKCAVVADKDGFVEAFSSTLAVNLAVSDFYGNSTKRRYEYKR